MNLIGEDYKALDITSEENQQKYYWQYDIKDRDFYLTLGNIWAFETSEDRWYTLAVGKSVIRLPASVFLMVADVHGNEVDWVKVEELPGRTLPTALYSSSLHPDKWTIEEVTVIGIDEELSTSCYPKTKRLLPAYVESGKMVLICEKDAFIRTKKFNYANLY